MDYSNDLQNGNVAPLTREQQMAAWAAEDEEAAKVEREQRRANGDHEQLFNDHFNRTTPHADRPKFVSGTTLSPGVHVIKLENLDGTKRQVILLEDADSSTLLEG